MSEVAYPLKSSALFVSFQIFLLPLTILTSMLGIEAIHNAVYPVVQYQSLVTTTLFNYVVNGQTRPASIYVWWLVAVPLHGVAGLLLGRFLQNRLHRVSKGVRILGSLVVFEAILTGLMVSLTKTSLWVEVWRMPSGW